MKRKTDPEKEGLNTVISYSKYAVGGESKEVPASAGLDENDNFIHRREQNQPKQKRVERRSKVALVGLKDALTLRYV